MARLRHERRCETIGNRAFHENETVPSYDPTTVSQHIANIANYDWWSTYAIDRMSTGATKKPHYGGTT